MRVTSLLTVFAWVVCACTSHIAGAPAADAGIGTAPLDAGSRGQDLEVVVYGNGSVTSSDGQRCSDHCNFLVSGPLRLQATAWSWDWRFDGWGGQCAGLGDCSVGSETASVVTARFVTVNCDVSGDAGAPQKLVATAGIRSAALSWGRPGGFDDCPYLGYEITIRSDGATRIVQTTQTQIELNGFTNNDGIVLSLVTVSPRARSTAVEQIVEFPETPVPPGNVVAFAHSTGVMVEWTTPTITELSNPLQNIYPTTAWVVSGPNDIPRVVVDPAARYAFIPDVVASGPYQFSVAGRSAVGDSLWPTFAGSALTPSYVWRFAGAMPEPRSADTIVALNSAIYFLGGFDNPPSIPARVASFDADGSIVFRGESGASIPFAAGVASVQETAVASTVLVVGGVDLSGPVATVTLCDLADGSVTGCRSGPAFPIACAFPTTFTVQRTVVVVGCVGQDANFHLIWHADVFYASLTTDGTLQEWQSGPALPTGRSFSAAAVSGNHAYVIGGVGGPSGEFSEVLVAELSNGTFGSAWRPTLPMPHSVSSASAGVIGGHLYVLGGDSSDRVLIGDLDPNSGDVLAWHEDPANKLLGARSSFGFLVSGQRLYVCGGQAQFDGAFFSDCQTALVDESTGNLVPTTSP
jgi:hypothetical protein